MKLEKLTPEQKALLPELRDKWLKIGLSCEPCDFERAKRGAIKAYKAAGLEPPKLFLLADSPVHCAMMATFLKQESARDQVRAQVRAQVGDQVGAQVRAQVWDQVRDQVGDQVGDQVWDQVWDQVGDQVWAQVWAQVRDQVGDQVGAQVRAQVWDQVWDQVGDQVRAQVGAQVRAQVWDQVRDQVGDQVWDQVGAQVYGSHDSFWLGFYDFFHQTQLCKTPKLNGLWDIAHSCGWWHPMQDVVIFQHRHDSVSLVDGQLHNESGPSVHYRDGLSVYSIRGVRVNEQIVMRPDTQTIHQINSEQNAEIKRIRIDRFGWERYLSETNASVIEKRRNDVEATIESLMQTNDMRVLVGACPSTGRVYAMEVDPSCDTCGAAQHWLRGSEQLNPIGAS